MRPLLRLRPVVAEDWTSVHAWAQVPEVSRYQPWGPNTPTETEAYVAAAARAWTDPALTWHVWAAVGGQDTVLGLGELTVHGTDGVGEIGYAVHHEHWRQGLGRSLARLLRDVGFERLGLHLVYATCDPRNVASVSVLRSIGMQHEGTLRQNLRLRDGWRDSHVFGILRDEWRALDPEPVGDRVVS